MYEYDEECLKIFLKKQLQLFDEPVAESMEEAEAFLEDCNIRKAFFGFRKNLFLRKARFQKEKFC